MNRSTGILFAIAGLLTLALYALFEALFSDAAFYDAQSFVDYVTVISVTSVLVLTGIALILLWKDPPVARGSVFLLLAGIGAIAEGTGNLLEDIFDIESAVWAFFGGGIVMMLSLVIAGVAALTVDSPQRWSGLFILLAVPGALLGFGTVMMGVAWLLLGLWIVYRHRAFVIAVAALWLPLVAAAIYVNI